MISDFSYGFGCLLKGIDFDDAVAQVNGALGHHGFGVLSEIDVQETLKNKLGVEFRRYVILGACNPALAHRALASDPHVGLLLPCNVVVQEMSGGDIGVSMVSPREIFTLAGGTELRRVSEYAEFGLRRTLDRVCGF